MARGARRGRTGTTRGSAGGRPSTKEAKSYAHPEATSLLRPDVGTQAQFRKKKPPQRYRYDSSLSPALDWDGQNPARERGEEQLAVISDQLSAIRTKLAGGDNWDAVADSVSRAEEAANSLTAMSRPFLDWAGKAERLSFDVPTLPLFVHERLSTKAILETLKGHKRDRQLSLLDLFNDPQHPIHDQVLRAYEYPDNWVNRLILGDSLVVMNSLLHYESLGGQVQMIYMDPPYGVRFGSNFQPFVRKRDVKHNDDADLTREPEMVKAYRDTWELGLHSYLTYLRDRLLLCRELLAPSGSVFVQISDENLHHVRELLDEVFGSENFVSLIPFVKTAGLGASGLPVICDYLLWYARNTELLKYRQLFASRSLGDSGSEQYTWLELPDGSRRQMTRNERDDASSIPRGARAYRLDNLTSGAFREKTTIPYTFEGRTFHPGADKCWKTTKEGLDTLVRVRRLQVVGNTLAYVRFIDDFPVQPTKALWTDTGTGGFGEDKLYAVQTTPKGIARCLLMTTDPGDLVLDPTCGSGTTAYVAEQWGRRWISVDTSRVPLALARQRLLTATFSFYQLKEEKRGPAGGFVYLRKQNSKGEEVGGIVPHVTLKSIAINEPPEEEVLVDRPEVESKITRVTGAFCVEATIPTPVDWEGQEQLPVASGQLSAKPGTDNRELTTDDYSSFVDRMLEVLRKSPVLHVGGGKTVTLRNVRPPAKTLSLSAEAVQEQLSVVSDQWSAGDEHGTGVQGSGRVAEGDGARDGSISCDGDVSEGGAVRADQPASESRGVRSEQHRGGPGAPEHGGVSPVSGPSQRIAAGTGDSAADREKLGVSAADKCRGAAGQHGRAGAYPERPDAVSEPLTTDNRQLSTAAVAIVFGPENGAVSEKLVYEAAREAYAKSYTHLYVIGFAIQPNARQLVDQCEQVVGVPATYVQATPDLMMGDLLKNMRSSQIFSVCGLPEVRVVRCQHSVASKKADNRQLTADNFQAELVGLDVFDPAAMEAVHRGGDDVPAWFLDTDYNGLCFHVCQAFFPRTAAWDDLKKALKGEYEDAVWEHLAGTISAPFEAGEHGQIAVKVIDDRGNELLVVKSLKDAEHA